jgi:hypothetical protein
LIKEADSTLPVDHPARLAAGGNGSRMIRGAERKQADELAAQERRDRKSVIQCQLITQMQEAQKEACDRAKVFMCKYCARPFVRQKAFKDHVSTCKAQAESKAQQRTKVKMRFGSDIAKDPVHKVESLAVGETVQSRGQLNRDLSFPCEWQMSQPSEVICVPQGWARKNVGVTHSKFTAAQITFLRDMFDAHKNGGHKVRESEARVKMQDLFADTSPTSEYSSRLVLKESQIKSWFSQECRRRKLLIGKTVVERGVSEMCASNDVPALGAADDALRVQAEEAPGEEEAPAVSSCQAGTELRAGLEEDEDEGIVCHAHTDNHLLTGTLYIIVKELWQETLGFEVWEVKVDFDGIGALPDELMVRKDVMARKWVHDATLVGAKEGTETVTDIPELAGGVFKLGKSGERRYAPSTGRRWANFSEIEPALCGDIWLRMVGVKVEMWSDSGKKQARVSIVLKSQVALVNRAYTLLDNLGV